MSEMTREELYKQVWSKPATKLAKEFGISDVAIAKICAKHNIPKPPPGYWAMLQHGHKVDRPALPRVEDTALKIIRFTPTPDEARRARLTSVTRERMRSETIAVNRIVVQQKLSEPHPLIERTERSLRSASPDAEGIVRPKAKGCLDVAVAPESVDRAMRIMDALIKGMEARGIKVSVKEVDSSTMTVIVVDGETMDVRLREMIGKREREFTMEEKLSRMRWNLPMKDKPTERYPRGLLVLSFGGEDIGFNRQRWSESEGGRLEERLNAIVSWLYKGAERAKGNRRLAEIRKREREEQQRQWAEQRRLQEEAEKLRREEQERVKELIAQAEAWHQSQRLRAYVAAVEDAASRRGESIEPDTDKGRWIRWAKDVIHRLDPITS